MFAFDPCYLTPFYIMQVGNVAHKTGVLAGLGCVAASLIPRDGAANAMLPLAAASVAAAALYKLAVGSDPMQAYQLDETGELAKLFPQGSLMPGTSYIILVRRGNAARCMLHNVLGAASIYLCARRHPELVTTASGHIQETATAVAEEGIVGMLLRAQHTVATLASSAGSSQLRSFVC